MWWGVRMSSAEAHMSELGAEPARHLIDTYVDAWNEPSADARGRMLAEVMHGESTYTDPNVALTSRADLDAYIGEVLRKYPGRRIVRTSGVDVHHRHCRFNWRLIKPDGTQGLESIDFVEFTSDGRIARVTGFFGPLAPPEHM